MITNKMFVEKLDISLEMQKEKKRNHQAYIHEEEAS